MNTALVKTARVATLISLTLLAAACAGGDGLLQDPDAALLETLPIATERIDSDPTDSGDEPVSTEAPPPANLIPASELVTNCLNHPAQEITVENSLRLSVGLTEGRPAVEFSLWGTDGSIYSLSELLRTKPVLIVLGGFT
jgi:hypothetical protein